MKCPNCGTEVGNANFCTECGAPLKAGLVRAATAQEDDEKKKPKRISEDIKTVVEIIAAITNIILAIYTILKG